MTQPATDHSLTRAGFIRLGAQTVAAATALGLARSAAAAPASSAPAPAATGPAPVFDLREFERWIVDELEPSVRLPGGAGRYARVPGETSPELYGTADMACILHTLGRLHPTETERTEWAAAFQQFQQPATGWLVEHRPTHSPLHNTAFALGAMELLGLAPRDPVRMGAEYGRPREFLETLDWTTRVYPESHKGAGCGAIFALVPALGTPAWFEEYFAACDALFDPRNGLMGRGKPPGGDYDQVGGTFHYSFLYAHFNRRMPYSESRIDAVLGTRRADGYWSADNHLWLTLDAVYLLTRTLRYCPHRRDDIIACVRSVMANGMRDIFSPAGRRTAFSAQLTVHSVTAAISLAAEAQNFLGAQEVITDRPLHLVLDRRPFI